MSSSDDRVKQLPDGELPTLPLYLNGSTSSGSITGGKSPLLRRVPPPRFSQALQPVQEQQQQQQQQSQHWAAASVDAAYAGLGLIAESSHTLRGHSPSPSLSSGAWASDSRTQSHEGNGTAPTLCLPQDLNSTSPSYNTTPMMHSMSSGPGTTATLQQRQASPARPAIMTRTSSGGARIAALASKFGSSAVQKVSAARQQVQLSASAAIASASSSRTVSPNNGGGSGPSNTTQDFSTVRTIAGGFRDKGTNFVNGAAARIRSKGKERSLTAPDSVSGTGNSPRLGSAGSSPNPQGHSPELQQSASYSGSGAGGGLGRRPSVSSRVVLGHRIPNNTAGVVFGAPLKVAADRTKMSSASIQDLPSRYSLGHASAERRKEACRYLPAIAIRCLDYLNEYGKSEEGLYRVPGSSQQVANIRAIFDSGSDVDLLSTLSTTDLEPSAVASCFKLWLRELPSSLLHSLEREINILLMEHTGNAASARVAMAQAQSGPSSSSVSQAGNGTERASTASPVVVDRIRELFSQSLPRENLVLLREISYHLAHLDAYSAINKMTFSNLRLILSPTLKLSPVMLSLLVNERESIFPKPGQLDSPNIARLSMSFSNSGDALGLSFQQGGDDFLPPLPSKPAKPTLNTSYKSSSDSQSPPSVRAPFSSMDSGWSAISSVSGKRSTGSLANYRASWHVVDLPTAAGLRNSETDDDDDITSSSTPIARKFLHSRNVSASNLLEKGSSSPVSLNGSKTSPLQRTPTFSGFPSGRHSPSPFFSSGAPAAGSAFMSSHARKRSSISSVHSLQSSAGASRSSAEWRPYNKNNSSNSRAVEIPARPEPRQQQEEEEELSSSDTSTTISSTSSAITPKDSHQQILLSPPVAEEGLDTRRNTITAETFASLGVGGGGGGVRSRLGGDKSDEMKKKRGSMMIMNLPDMSSWKGEEAGGGLLSVEERRRLFQNC